MKSPPTTDIRKPIISSQPYPSNSPTNPRSQSKSDRKRDGFVMTQREIHTLRYEKGEKLEEVGMGWKKKKTWRTAGREWEKERKKGEKEEEWEKDTVVEREGSKIVVDDDPRTKSKTTKKKKKKKKKTKKKK
ncbi:hypothetical protein HZU67_01701 [Apis mellifera carnica]|nr:hypothetical protein HZU67_01701 [Apis mellifera carnica]